MRIISINLNGIRAADRKGFFNWLTEQQADVVCLQELKAQQHNMSDGMLNPEGYQGYFDYAEKKGYSGVGIYSKHPPQNVQYGLGIEAIDNEGRYIQLDFPKLSLISLYLPSGTSGEHRQQFKYAFMDKFLPIMQQMREQQREFIICGDWNIAHHEIDLKNWRGNRKNSGFLPEERAWMTQLFDQVGFVDVFRQLYPELAAYTWWSNRGQAWANNTGWRIDYQIATPGAAALASQASIYREQRFSDHAPLIIDYPGLSR